MPAGRREFEDVAPSSSSNSSGQENTTPPAGIGLLFPISRRVLSADREMPFVAVL